ncbi:alpha/beta hydrolase [Streptomyces sp. NPDC059637]|uniref:alpha/beta hydrolase n=1 Tax=Streptomyces sp. NPDC059637 TaxID=3347752 RepID=UPI0036D0E438
MKESSRTVSRTPAEEEASAFAHPPAAPDATVRYGDHPDQVVDLWAPGGRAVPAPAPLVVLVHGGAWREPYDRLHVSPVAAFLAGRGLAVASVEYRRTDGAEAKGGWPHTLDDVAAAVDAIPGLVEKALPGAADTGRTVLAGHSAGGQLVLWAASRHRLPAGSRWHRASPPPGLRGVVGLAPIAHFDSAVTLSVCNDAVTEFLGGPDLAPGRLPLTDPARILPAGVPVTLVHGRDDVDVPLSVSEAYVRAAAAVGEEPRLTVLEDTGHFPLIDPSADACSTVAEEIARLAR